MSGHAPFSYNSPEDLLKEAGDFHLNLPYQEDISPLLGSFRIEQKLLPNRLLIQPMEGADAAEDGTPSELTRRRYLRYAEGGAGTIWFEAAAVVPEGRSNPRQLMLSNKNIYHFRKLVESVRKAARIRFGEHHDPLCVLQLTHSGRYSKPEGEPRPLVAAVNPHLDRNPGAACVLSDDDLDRLQLNFVSTANLAYEAGFDAVDIKACHGYLVNELLGAYTRKKSRYGHDFNNRVRFLSEVISRIRAERADGLIFSRLSSFDGIPYPHGFGFVRNRSHDIDVTELNALILRLKHVGCSMINISAGNPHFAPYIGRPYDRDAGAAELPDEHPLEGVTRLIHITAGVQLHFPSFPVVGSGYSWLRGFFPNVGASVIRKKEAALIGLGRLAFAYPDAPKDLMESGGLDFGKVCLTCSHCSRLLRHGQPAGCVVRDKEFYKVLPSGQGTG